MKRSLFFLLLLWGSCLEPLQAQYRRDVNHGSQETHPIINDILGEVSADSLASTMQWMVNMGTRYMYAENRREVAAMIADRFRLYGITDVVLDSFKLEGEVVPEDSAWQYNVIATVQGTSAPDEIYLISGHHDNYRSPDPHLPIPGADDDASGCAVALEFARVLKAKGYQPPATIRFATWAAEELMGYVSTGGSRWYADKMSSQSRDLRLILNCDMVAYAGDTNFTITGTAFNDRVSGWAGELMCSSASRYTRLTIHKANYATPDAMRFQELGYPVTGFQERWLNPTYHSVNDSVSRCNMLFCKEVAKASYAILLQELLTPVPQQPRFTADEKGVTLHWKPTKNQHVAGFNILRSTTPDTGFAAVGSTVYGESQFRDTTVLLGICYYYRITSFDHEQYESNPSSMVKAACLPRDRDLLIVKDSRGGLNNPPDSTVTKFYQTVFRNFQFDYCDASVTDSLHIATLGRYKRIVWLSAAYSDQTNSAYRRNSHDITGYLENGGDLFISGFQPTFLIEGNNKLNKVYVPADTLNRWYKVARVDRKPGAALNGSWPCTVDYDTLRIDPAKGQTVPSGHVYNVECITPSQEANIIYRFNSAFDTTTSQGKMKGRPVGTEYLGADYRLILLMVPLYYLDSVEAQHLASVVLDKKFTPHVGFDEFPGEERDLIPVLLHPNPAAGKICVTYQLRRDSPVELKIIGGDGRIGLCRREGVQKMGTHCTCMPIGNLSAGVYLIQLTTDYGKAVKRAVFHR